METTTRPQAHMLALGLALLSLAFFALNIDFLMRGDATTYATYALLGKFDDITLHNGYYFLMYAVQRWLAHPLGIPVHETLAWVNVLFGAIGTVLVFRLIEELIGNRAVSVAAAVLFMVSGRVIMNATSSEIYMMQTVFVLLSMLCYARSRPFSAGISAGIALLVSPLSAFAFLFFPAWELTRKDGVQWKTFGVFVLAGTLVYAPYLLTCWRELFWGRRGLLVVREAARMDLSLLAVNTLKYQFKHYTALWLLMIPAVIHWREQRRFAWISLATVLPHLYIVAKLTTEDHTFLLNADAFICAWMALGAFVLVRDRRFRWLAPVPLVLHLGLYLRAGMLFSGEHNKGYADELKRIAQTHIVGKAAVMITDWDVAIAMTHFGRTAVNSIPEKDPLFKQMYDLTTDVGPWPSLDGVDLYLLDTWSPSPINRMLRSPESLAALQQSMSVRRMAEARLGIACEEMAHLTHTLYKCERTGAPLTP
ncbi:MAG: hypothetical protein IBJ03_01280 [Gemmatimonadaceae bacterium]|nr:hypothetical protein [Gemmatimonadaceae bacterium]